MRTIILFFTVIILLTGCGKLHPYIVDVQQGNVVDAKARAKLRLGMNKKDVLSVLGSPVLVDTFDPNTWIYTYTKQVNGGRIEKKKLVLKFKNDRLVSLK